MIDKQECLPIDIGALSDAIKDLNVSRHNVSIYPKEHPIVETSMNQAYENIKKLFLMRREITLGIVGDSISIDDEVLDVQNRVYRDFAVSLNQKGIVLITINSNLTKDELYTFHDFLLSDDKNVSPEEIQSLYEKNKVPSIHVEFIDYSAFGIEDGRNNRDGDNNSDSLWEEYITGLMNGTLLNSELSEVIRKIPPHKLAEIINKLFLENNSHEGLERIISSYILESGQNFSLDELKKLVSVADNLDSEIQRDFLSSAANVISQNIDAVQAALSGMTTQEIIEFLSIINEQNVVVPDALKNVLRKFSMLNHTHIQQAQTDGKLMEDDFFLSEEMTSLLSESDFSSFVSDAYDREIQRLLDSGIKATCDVLGDKHAMEWNEEYVETVFNQTIIELISSAGADNLDQNECDFYINMLKDQIIHFVETGQYKQVLKSLVTLETHLGRSNLSDASSETIQFFKSPDFIVQLIESIRLMGREKKEDVFQLCSHYNDNIIPYLIDTLTDEGSQTIRRFLISLITHFGDMSAKHILQRLNDSRWFVKRNMLFMLLECGSNESLRKVKKLCKDEHIKVRLEAIKCLLKAGDTYALEPLRDLLRSKSNETIQKAANLAGTMHVNDVMPDLIQLLKKKNISRSNIEGKIPIVRALGQIKNPESEKMLKSIMSSGSLLFKSSIKKLKDEAASALKNLRDIQEGVKT